VNRLTWNEYPVMAAVAALAGIALFLLLQTLGSAPAGEQPLRRSERTGSAVMSPPTPSQVEAARQDRARRRAAAVRRRAREAAAAVAAAAATPPARSTQVDPAGSYGSQAYDNGQTGSGQKQQLKPTPDPKPQSEEPATPQGRSFDDSG
jgi:hypothetical protein